MNATDKAGAPETPLGPDLLHALLYYLRGRRGLIALTASVVAAGAALNRGWVAAAGVASLFVGGLSWRERHGELRFL